MNDAPAKMFSSNLICRTCKYVNSHDMTKGLCRCNAGSGDEEVIHDYPCRFNAIT